MSIIEQGGGALGAGVTRWVGYALAIIGLLLPLAPATLGGTALAVAALITPAVVFALLLAAPEAFGQTLRGSKTRTINLILILPALSLFISALGAGVLDSRLALLPAAICAAIAVLLGLGAAARPMPGSVGIAITFLLAFGGLYGYGGLVFADVRFDTAAPQTFQAVVQSRYTTHGRGTTHHHLVLGPWGPVAGTLTADVPAATYDALNPGDRACVSLHPGALKMEWYAVGPCNSG
jgi:hypothetical protein